GQVGGHYRQLSPKRLIARNPSASGGAARREADVVPAREVVAAQGSRSARFPNGHEAPVLAGVTILPERRFQRNCKVPNLNGEAPSLGREAFCLASEAPSLALEARCLEPEAFCLTRQAPSLGREALCSALQPIRLDGHPFRLGVEAGSLTGEVPSFEAVG